MSGSSNPAGTSGARREVGLVLAMAETWTMTDLRDLRRLVELVKIAEDAGISGVLVGEHPAMGPSADSQGRPANPRDWLMAFHQPPDAPFPAGIPLLAGIATVTSRIRLVAGAVIAPLRHPLLVAKDLATLDLLSAGRLSVIPTVSWQAEEYAALGVDFHHRGEMLDEHLEVWRRCWTGSPVSFSGKHYRFDDVYLEPGPFRPGGPDIWTGGKLFSPWMLRRVVRHGKGLFPIVPLTDDELGELAEAMVQAGRHIDELEMVSVLRTPPFPDAHSVIDLGATLESAPELVARGATSLLLKPSMFIDDDTLFEEFCHTAARTLDRVLAEA